MVDKKLNFEEIIEMAIQIETAGAAFYRRLGELAESDEAREMFVYLEKAEYKHIEDFGTVLKRALASSNQHQYATTREDLLYLRAFASRCIFNSPEDAVSKAEILDNVIEAIDMALDFELKSVDFFKEMADMIENPGDRSAVHELEKQEKEHAVYLSRMREKLAENKQ